MHYSVKLNSCKSHSQEGKKPLVLVLALLLKRKRLVLTKLPSLQHPRCGLFRLRTHGSFLFFRTAKPPPELSPLSPQRRPIGASILRTAASDQNEALQDGSARILCLKSQAIHLPCVSELAQFCHGSLTWLEPRLWIVNGTLSQVVCTSKCPLKWTTCCSLTLTFLFPVWFAVELQNVAHDSRDYDWYSCHPL